MLKVSGILYISLCLLLSNQSSWAREDKASHASEKPKFYNEINEEISKLQENDENIFNLSRVLAFGQDCKIYNPKDKFDINDFIIITYTQYLKNIKNRHPEYLNDINLNGLSPKSLKNIIDPQVNFSWAILASKYQTVNIMAMRKLMGNNMFQIDKNSGEKLEQIKADFILKETGYKFPDPYCGILKTQYQELKKSLD